MARRQITCVERNASSFDPQTLTAYGNPKLGWVINKAKAVAAALQGNEFIVHEAGFLTIAEVNGIYPNQFLKTTNDQTDRNNLVNLPNCPGGLTRY